MKLPALTLFASIILTACCTRVLAQVSISPSLIVVSEFEDATFSCSPLSSATSIVVEKRVPGSLDFNPISFDNPRFESEVQVENNREVFTYFNVIQDDNGTNFRCVLGATPSEVATLIVEAVSPDVLVLSSSGEADESVGPWYLTISTYDGEPAANNNDIELTVLVDDGGDVQPSQQMLTVTLLAGTSSVQQNYTINDNSDVDTEFRRILVEAVIVNPALAAFTVGPGSLQDRDSAILVIRDDDVQLPRVGFGEVDFSAVENSGGRLISVLKEGVNTDSLSVIVRALTIEQFNNLTNRVLCPVLVNRTRDIDPAEFTADRQDFNASIEEVVLFNASNVREETQVFIPYLDDGIDEAEEGFLVIVEMEANTPPFDFLNEGVALMTITDDDVATIGFENSQFTVNEGAGMQDNLIIKDIVSEQTLVILVDLSVGTSLQNPAVPGADFDIISLPATIDFSPDVQMISIPVNISEDAILEPTERFRLILSRPANSPNYNFGLTATTVSILDNEMGEIGFEQTEYTGNEGENVQPCILLFYNGNVSDLLVVDAIVFRIPGTAIDDDHSFFAFGELIRLNAAGSFKMCLDFDLTDDSEIEGTESFTLQLEPDPGFTPDNILVSPAAEFATIFIRDNDVGEVGFEQLEYTGNEGDSVEICVRLVFSGTVSDEFVVDVDLFADDDTATSADHSIPVFGELVLLDAPDFRMCFTVDLTDDSEVEGTERFAVRLVSVPGFTPPNVVLDPITAAVFINDDDVGEVGFEQLEYTGNEGDSVEICIRLVVSGTVSDEFVVDVDLFANDDTATSADHSIPPFGELVLLDAPDFRMCFTVDLTDDSEVEGTERFEVRLESVPGFTPPNVVLDPKTAAVFINDDDEPVTELQFTANSPQLTLSGDTDVQGDIFVAFSQPTNVPNALYTCTILQWNPKGPLMSYDCDTGSFTATGLSAGKYLIQVRLDDLNSGERTIIRRRIQVPTDVNACQPYLINAGVTIDRRNAIVEWSSTGNPAGFWCKLNRKPRFQCSSPVDLTRLAPGRQTLRIRSRCPRGLRRSYTVRFTLRKK